MIFDVIIDIFCTSEFSDFLKNEYVTKVIFKQFCNGFAMADMRLVRENLARW